VASDSDAPFIELVGGTGIEPVAPPTGGLHPSTLGSTICVQSMSPGTTDRNKLDKLYGWYPREGSRSLGVPWRMSLPDFLELSVLEIELARFVTVDRHKVVQ
jgi:hypothetical protein